LINKPLIKKEIKKGGHFGIAPQFHLKIWLRKLVAKEGM
jgi:hypothetical protein